MLALLSIAMPWVLLWEGALSLPSSIVVLGVNGGSTVLPWVVVLLRLKTLTLPDAILEVFKWQFLSSAYKASPPQQADVFNAFVRIPEMLEEKVQAFSGIAGLKQRCSHPDFR